MAKQKTAQKYIMKISSERLRRAKWNLTLPLKEARQNEEIISINDSQMLRWIDELNSMENTEDRVQHIRSEIRRLKRLESTLANRKAISKLYDELDGLQFKKDYMCLVIERQSDFIRACKGFYINGVKYLRLLGTNGGVKDATIVFANADMINELRRRIDNGRNTEIPQVPAKFEAYRALTCSGSIPVSLPNGILVVDDCITEFTEDIITLDDSAGGEPEMRVNKDAKIVLDESDGYGLMHPALAARWSEELGLDYVMAGANTRCSWEKGMVFTFDFIDFAEKVACKTMVKDAWGNEVDIRNVELVLTTSMLKLWKCYDSAEHYLRCCSENGYTFGIAKTCPRKLESERDLNYQFIQSYDLTDEEIDELIAPTANEIESVLSGDYRKALLFLRGRDMDDKSAVRGADDFVKAIMADPRVYDDPYVKRKIFHMIKKRITDAKVGVIRVHANYSMVSGDPYALCQNMFGLPVTGLLKKGEIYNRYWSDRGVERLACFRAPMTCHNNIRRVYTMSGGDIDYWYRYMNACTVFNAWDSSAQALNGMDKDGDLVLLTDNRVLVEKIKESPTIFCVQRTAEKMVVAEDDLVRANIASAGDDIGRTTNWITSMFDVQAQFSPDSEEYRVLDYRIKCGQLYQQNAIDKAKGIVCRPMPKSWYDRAACRPTSDMDERQAEEMAFYKRIVADKKPYFMRYIYPALNADYNTYIKNTDTKCLREFRITIDELMAKPAEQLTEREADFVRFYKRRMPVGTHPCVMNRICHRIEDRFDRFILMRCGDAQFDYNILKHGHDYTQRQYSAILQIYKNYNLRLQEIARYMKNGMSDEDAVGIKTAARFDFEKECYSVCSNKSQLCDIMLDICYQHENTKQFVWDMAGDMIIRNLTARNGGKLYYPARAEDGDIYYGMELFVMREVMIHDACSERTSDSGECA